MTKEELFSVFEKQRYNHKKEGAFDIFTYENIMFKHEFLCDERFVRVTQNMDGESFSKLYTWNDIEKFKDMIDLAIDFGFSRFKEIGHKK